ncbi:MAG: hypothetical protein KIS96_14570 [Bauldia sp.]|nr:hypothetical protein [Bauldia sp.]
MRFGARDDGTIMDAEGRSQPADLDTLGVYAAFRQLGAALEKCGIRSVGPLRGVLLALSGENYDQLREALNAADDFSRQLTRGCGHGRVSSDRLMIAGIEIYRAE